MNSGELAKHVTSLRRQTEPDPSGVVAVREPLHQPEVLDATSELAGGVVLHEQRLCDLPDGRAALGRTAAHREHQLVLGMGQPMRLGGLTTPLVETAQSRPECEQTLELRIGGHNSE